MVHDYGQEIDIQDVFHCGCVSQYSGHGQEIDSMYSLLPLCA